MPEEKLRTLWFARHLCCESQNLSIKMYRFPSPGSLASAMRKYNKIVCHVANSWKVLCIDAEKTLRKNLEYFIDDVHYTKKGASALAEVIAENICLAVAN